MHRFVSEKINLVASCQSDGYIVDVLLAGNRGGSVVVAIDVFPCKAPKNV